MDQSGGWLICSFVPSSFVHLLIIHLAFLSLPFGSIKSFKIWLTDELGEYKHHAVPLLKGQSIEQLWTKLSLKPLVSEKLYWL